MISELEVKENLASLLTNELSLEDFDRWLVEKSWNMHLDSAVEAQELVGSIELSLAEYSNGHLSWEELKNALRPHVQSYSVRIQLGTSAPAVVFSTDSEVETQSVPVDISPSEGSASLRALPA